MRKWFFGLCFLLTACGVNVAERNNTGNYLTLSGDFDAAVNAYQVAQVQDPDNAIIYFNSAGALAASERMDEAEAALEQAIERGDELLAADAYYNLGNIYFALDDYQQAIIFYRQALLINPAHEAARYNLEIANARRLKPTPTAMEMQTELEEEPVNASETPTPNPAGEILPTPTPTPPEALPPPGETPIHEGDDDQGDESKEDSSDLAPRLEGEMDVEDAELMLEPIEASYERLSTFRDNYNLQESPEGDKDW
jgi:Ca-activated chloride channel family protein